MGFAAIAKFRQQYVRATHFLAAAHAVWASADVGPDTLLGDVVEDVTLGCRAALNEEDFEAAWEEGQTMRVEQAVAYTLGGDRSREHAAG